MSNTKAVKPSGKFWKENRGLLFILPWLIGFLVFKGYPFLSSLIYSFSDESLFEGISGGVYLTT